MATIRGFHFPENLYYLVDRHVWVRPVGGGVVRLGLTPVAYHFLRNTIVAITVKASNLGREVEAGKSLAMVESHKYIGPLAAPFRGVFLRGNDHLADNPDLAAADPYGEGWIAEMRPADEAAALAGLLTGEAALAAYRSLLEAGDISQD